MEKKKAIRESIEQAAAPSYNDIKQINIIEPTHNVADINPDLGRHGEVIFFNIAQR